MIKITAKVFQEENKLIKKLKKQHEDILFLFKNLNSFIEGKDISKTNCMLTLLNLKSELIKHLTLEDKKLYPELDKSKDEKTRKTSKKFSNEMKGISQAAVDFFNKYSNLKVEEIEKQKSFKKEIKELKEVVKVRIELEEKVLYPLYEKNPLSTENEKDKIEE
ncbi:hemerythrin domain-containing protein [Candidatus Woesearchaeota archaeon]|nr:hemerythrin domain-containing protein [Candidatus Woesearchaeota archaeon]